MKSRSDFREGAPSHAVYGDAAAADGNKKQKAVNTAGKNCYLMHLEQGE